METPVKEQATPTPNYRERRKVVRVNVLGQLHGQEVALNTPVSVREIGTGGFSIEATAPFPPGSVYQFRFSIDYGSSVELLGKSKHCLRVSGADRVPIYLAGFEFLQKDEATRSKVVDLVNQITAVLAVQPAAV